MTCRIDSSTTPTKRQTVAEWNGNRERYGFLLSELANGPTMARQILGRGWMWEVGGKLFSATKAASLFRVDINTGKMRRYGAMERY
jgi:hypothetical protein